MSPRLALLNRSSWSFGIFVLVTTGCLAGCGSGGKPVGSNPAEDTSLSVILTSTGNDSATVELLQLQSLTLTNQTGQSVTLFSGDATTPATDFVHLNGATEPYVTASIPQGVYTSAAVTVGEATYTCVVNLSDGLNDSTYSNPNATATVDLPSPITVGPLAMGVVLNLQLAPPENFQTCVPTTGTFPILPKFELTATPFGSLNTASANGNPGSFRGIVSSIGSGGILTVNSADGPPLTVATQSTTSFQGVSGISAITAGMQVDVDTIFNTDGSLGATRLEVDDTATTDLNIFSGPVIQVPNAVSILDEAPQQQYGFISNSVDQSGAAEFNYANAVFQVSSELTNVSTLPFAATFTAANMVPGQSVSLTGHVNNENGVVPVTTATLKPQTINGTIASISTSGSFQVYTVTLAPYDLFPDLALQAGQNQPITNPQNVQVYVDSYTLNASSSVLSIGSVLRFRGLIFSNTGELAMDCSEVELGVTE